MSKSLIPVILIIVLIAGAAFIFTRQKPAPAVTKQLPPVAQESPVAAGNTNPATTKNSLRNLIAAGGTLNCTYADTAANAAGTMKVNGSQVRGDFATSIDGQNAVTHMISDGKFMYLWSDGTGAQGMKYDLSTMPTPGAGSQTPSGQPQSLDMDKQYDYQCTPWTVDTSVFTPPAEIKFQDLSNLMKNLVPKVSGAPESGKAATGASAACAACASLTGAAKTQCLATLNCN